MEEDDIEFEFDDDSTDITIKGLAEGACCAAV